MSKQSVVFFASEQLAETIKTTAQERHVSASALICEAVAEFLDYDLAADPKTERGGRKYANKAERDKAMRERAKAKRQKTKAMMDAIKRGETQETIMALARSLVGKSETADAIVAEAEAKA